MRIVELLLNRRPEKILIQIFLGIWSLILAVDDERREDWRLPWLWSANLFARLWRGVVARC